MRVAMKGIVLLLLVGLLLVGCKKDEPVAVAAVVVAAPKVTAETREKGEKLFVYLDQMEMRLTTSWAKDAFDFVGEGRGRLMALDRAVAGELSADDLGKWNMIHDQMADVIQGGLLYLQLKVKEMQGFDIIDDDIFKRDYPDRLIGALEKQDGNYWIVNNYDVVLREMRKMRMKLMADWDALIK